MTFLASAIQKKNEKKTKESRAPVQVLTCYRVCCQKRLGECTNFLAAAHNINIGFSNDMRFSKIRVSH